MQWSSSWRMRMYKKTQRESLISMHLRCLAHRGYSCNLKRCMFFLALILSLGLALVPFNGTSLAATKHLSTKNTTHASYKLTATLDNKHPKQYGTVHLMVKGLPSGTKYKAVFHYRTKDTTYYGKVGKSLTVRISRATKGFKVKINISATYKGKTYKTETYFIPR